MRGLSIAMLLVVAGCGDDDATGADLPERMPADGWLTPSPEDHGAGCWDVGHLRACWDEHDEGCVDGVCRVERAVPAEPPAIGGWRCYGNADARRCVPQRLGGGAFECDGDRCVQAHPRLPDAAFWECIDDDGIVVCRGGDQAAGVFGTARDQGWLCGSRRGGEGERICIDAAPDMPRGERRGWKCHFEHDAGEQRHCVAEEGAPGVGAPCDATDDCVVGTVCAGGACLPQRLVPSCALDGDCPHGLICRFGTCMRGEEG